MQEKSNHTHQEAGLTQEKEDWIKEFDKKLIHYLWTILVSLVTAIVTTVLIGKLL